MNAASQPAAPAPAVPSPAWTPEVQVMFRPAAAYRELLASDPRKHSALWRFLLVAFFLGCMASLITSQRLTLRHVADGALNASFILMGQVVALAVVRGRERTVPFVRALDLFFAGYGPWLLWILGVSAVWAFAPPMQAFAWAGTPTLLPSAALVALWSGYIDFRFFEQVLGRTPGRAAWDLARQWFISWSLALVIFGGGPLISEHMRMLGR